MPVARFASRRGAALRCAASFNADYVSYAVSSKHVAPYRIIV